jgi:death on curing protein
MISKEETEKLHRVLIANFGGTHGVRDVSALESALSRPFQTFDNAELYPSAIEKAASLIVSILNNHPFVDGNKRTGYTLLRLFLINNGLDINATPQENMNSLSALQQGTEDLKKLYCDWNLIPKNKNR